MGNADISEKAISPKGKSTQEAQTAPGPLLVSNLGWSVEEVQETRDAWPLGRRLGRSGHGGL